MSSIREVSRLDLSSALRLAKKLVYRQSDEELKKQQLLKEKLSAAKPVDSVPPQITPLLPRPYPKIIKADARDLRGAIPNRTIDLIL
ncbi:MAG: hypothetical protein DCC75_13920, partial [Proteobacteria bacterium]